ncbi:MAG: isoprenylcysteine carboxylmethyltransferase family protein [bacterium]
MMMQEPFSTKHRIYWSRLLGAVLLLYVVLSRPSHVLPPWVMDIGELLGLILLAIAAFGRVWCLVFIAGKKNDVLITEGPYSVVRNPLYIFSFLGTIGFGLAGENPLLTVLLAVLFGLYYPFVVKREERFLASHFAPEFQEYCARTPRWLPNFRLYTEPQTLTVSPLKIRKGILDAMWFIWAFFLWELLEELRVIG